LKDAPSIWESEMPEKIKDKDYVTQHKESLIFDRNGCLRLFKNSIKDMNKIAFAEVCNHNVKNNTGSKMAFYLYDPSAQEKAMLEREFLEMEMTSAVKEMAEEPLKRHASYLGVNFLDELGKPKTVAGIRRDVMI